MKEKTPLKKKKKVIQADCVVCQFNEALAKKIKCHYFFFFVSVCHYTSFSSCPRQALDCPFVQIKRKCEFKCDIWRAYHLTQRALMLRGDVGPRGSSYFKCTGMAGV